MLLTSVYELMKSNECEGMQERSITVTMAIFKKKSEVSKKINSDISMFLELLS